MTVDFDSITKDVNRHSKLMNDIDVSNVNKIVDANPSIFELGWDQPKTKRRDAGVYFKKVIRDGVEVDKPKYGFTFFIPTQIPQYQLFDGTILNCTLFKYLDGTKGLWFDADDPSEPEWELVHFQDDPPLLAPSINAMCQLVTDITGNTNTQPLKDYLDVLDNLETDRHDWSFMTLWMSKKNKSVKIGLSKNDDALIGDEVNGILDKVCGSKNSNAYKNTQQMFNTLGLGLVESPNAIVTTYVEFDSTGLKKEVAFEMGVSHCLDAPHGTRAMDDYSRFTDYQSSYKDGISMIMNNSKDSNWISDDWRSQIESWETCENIQSTFGDVIVTSSKEGWKTELLYGLSGSRGGVQPTNFIRGF